MHILENLSDYFNLAKPLKKSSGITTLSEDQPKPNKVWPQYLALVFGIVIQPFLEAYIQSNSWPDDLSTLLGRTSFGIILGLVIFPGVYKRSWDNTNPLFVQLCTIVSAGLGWQTLFSAAAHAI